MDRKNNSYYLKFFFIIFVFIQLIILPATSELIIQRHTTNQFYDFLPENKDHFTLSGYADLDLISLEVWWADISNGTLYVRYKVKNIGETYHNSNEPILLNISLKNNSNEKPFAYIHQPSFIDPNTWYFTETLAGCVQIKVEHKPENIIAFANQQLQIPEHNLENNQLSTSVFNGIIIKGMIKNQQNLHETSIPHCTIMRCNETSLQSRLPIRFETNKSGYYKVSLYPKKPLTDAHKYHLLITVTENDRTLLCETPNIHYNSTHTQNIIFNGTPPKIPMKPIGFPLSIQYLPYFILTYSIDQDQDEIWYKIKWDYYNYSSWIGPYQSYQPIVLRHSWKNSGVNPIKVIAKDSNSLISSWSEKKNVRILKNPILSKT